MQVAARARYFLARHPSAYWLLVALVAVVAGFSVQTRLSELDRARRQWQDTRSVLVADADLEPGGEIVVSRVEFPLLAVPARPVGSIPDDAVLRQRVSAGEVLVVADLASISGPAARAGPGTVVVGLTDPLSREVAIGLHVQIAADGTVLAPTAVVVGIVDGVIFVAVAADEAPVVAAAAQAGSASLLFLP